MDARSHSAGYQESGQPRRSPCTQSLKLLKGPSALVGQKLGFPDEPKSEEKRRALTDFMSDKGRSKTSQTKQIAWRSVMRVVVKLSTGEMKSRRVLQYATC